jgi:integrase/recombinase XerD
MSYSVNAVIRLNKLSKTRNEVPVCIRIIKDRQTSYKTIFKINPEYWDSKNSKVKKSCPTANEMNASIAQNIAEVEKDVLLIGMTTNEYGVNSIRNKIHNNSSLDFFEYATNYNEKLQAKGKISLYKRYKTITNKFKAYVSKDLLPVNNINLKLINDYEAYLIKTFNNSPNTVTSNMKILSKFVNDIFKEYKLDKENNPFINYKYPSEETKREFLDEDELKRIINLKLTPINKLFDAKQIFIFECYTGLRIADILTLRWKNLHENKISIKTRKTGKKITLALPEKIKIMIEQKKRSAGRDINSNKYIFNILKNDLETLSPTDAHGAINSATAIINKKLKQIAVNSGIKKTISTHTARHTFATRLISKGANIYVVQELLGHSSMRMTQIYAKVVDNKMESTINLLND